MFSNLDTGDWLVIGLSAFLLVWFFTASIFNRNRGLLIFRWLRRGLEPLGKGVSTEWLGSSGTGARISVSQPQAPFNQLLASYALETREILPYWILTRLRGRRDEITIFANFRKIPRVEILFKSKETSKHKIVVEESDRRRMEQFTPPEPSSSVENKMADTHSRKIETLMEQLPGWQSIRGFSIQKKKPHMMITASIGLIDEIPAETFFTGIAKWIQSNLD